MACGYVLFSALVSAWSAWAIGRQRRAQEMYGEVLKAH
jgi:hypothetical protein